MKMSFLEPWEKGIGAIVISDVPKEVLQKLQRDFIVDFIVTTMPTPNGHQGPTYALRHSDEPDDCSENDFKRLVTEYQATVV